VQHLGDREHEPQQRILHVVERAGGVECKVQAPDRPAFQHQRDDHDRRDEVRRACEDVARDRAAVLHVEPAVLHEPRLPARHRRGQQRVGQVEGAGHHAGRGIAGGDDGAARRRRVVGGGGRRAADGTRDLEQQRLGRAGGADGRGGRVLDQREARGGAHAGAVEHVAAGGLGGSEGGWGRVTGGEMWGKEKE